MGANNPICVPDELISPPGLDPREESEEMYLLEAVSKGAPGVPYELPDIPVEALLSYLKQFEETASTPSAVVKGFIDAEVLATHTTMRGIAEKLRRDLVAAADLYEKSGRKVTKEVRGAVEAAQATARTSLSNVRMQTRSFRLLSQGGVALQFEGVKQPWKTGIKRRLNKLPAQMYSSKELFSSPELASKYGGYISASDYSNIHFTI